MVNTDEVEIKDFMEYLEREVDTYVEDLKKSRINPKKIAIRKIILDNSGNLKPGLRDKLLIQMMGEYTKQLKKGKTVGCLQDKKKEITLRDGIFMLRLIKR